MPSSDTLSGIKSLFQRRSYVKVLLPPHLNVTVADHSTILQTNVSIHQASASRSSRNFHLPHSYVPERFLPSATDDSTSPFYNDNRAVMQPFSVGPRNCIGRNLAYNEMRLILARVLWNFDLELCDESRGWSEQKSYVLWEKPALWCKLSLRKR